MLQSFADCAAVAIHKSELFEANLRLDRTDHETDLEKYAPFLERIRASIERAQTLNEKFGLMVLDIDNFKHISAMYGYESSRKMLKEMGGLIKSQLRNIDAAGRHALDEFIVLRANSDVDQSLRFADQIRSAVEQSVFTNHGIKTTVSVGIAVFPQHAGTIDELLIAVKHAVYEAQRSGRNRITCFRE